MGTTDPKGALQITSTTSGVIIPQFADLTVIEAIKKADGTTALNTDEQGMQVYNIAEKKIYMWDGTAWARAATAGDGNNTAGSAGIGSAYGEVASTTGKVWLDRNLGATQVATSSTDTASYGDLYQWGRGADGHEDRNSLTIAGPVANWLADEGSNAWDGLFITESNWLSTTVDNLWTGTGAENNPCPSGFRVPTNSELNQERRSWATNDAAGAFASPLKLPLAGARNTSGTLVLVGVQGFYWSSTIDTNGRDLDIESNKSTMSNRSLGLGASVRCIKD